MIEETRKLEFLSMDASVSRLSLGSRLCFVVSDG